LIPEMVQREGTPVVSLPQVNRSPAVSEPSYPGDLMREIRSLADTVIPRPPKERVEPELPGATFISDNNLEDGHVFPPGAEFVKTWRMRNTGNVDWIPSTTLAFVGGHRLGNGPKEYKLGHVVKVGEEIDVEVLDNKAPELPGIYVSYWRLKDENGRLFGDRVWCGITVADPELSESLVDSNPEMAHSSLVVPAPPSTAPAQTTAAPGSPSVSATPASVVSFTDEDSTSDDSGLWEDAGARSTGDANEYVLVDDTESEDN